MKFYVYEHWRLDKDECFYVGKGNGKRAYSRCGRNTHWRNIVAKLEREGFGYEVRLVATGLTEEESLKLEMERISFWSGKVDLANIVLGGGGIAGYRHTKESKKKIGDASRGKPRSLETKQKIKNSKQNISEETREKLRQASLGHEVTPEMREKLRLGSLGNTNAKGNKAFKGKKHSPESLEKMRLAKREWWAQRKLKKIHS